MHYLRYLQPLCEQAGGEGSGSDIINSLSNPEGFIDENDDPNDDDPSKSQQQQQQQQQQETFVPNPMWEHFKSDAEFKLPEGLTKENETQLLEAQLKAKYGAPQTLHPLAKQIQDIAEKNPNVSINDIISEVQSEYIDISKMSVDEKISFHLKNAYGVYDEKENPDGLTPEDIEQHISKMSKIEKAEMSKSIELAVENYNKELSSSFQARQKEQFAANYEKAIADNEKYINEIKNDIPKIDKIFGIPVSQEDHNAFIEEFKSYITPDKETGIRQLDLMLSDNTTLYKIFVSLVKHGEEKVIEAITKGREGTKEELFRKLGISPNFSSSRDKRERLDDPESIASALASPER